MRLSLFLLKSKGKSHLSFQRKLDHYLKRLIDKKENGLVKVITGTRRCGKSFLLFHLFYDYLIEGGVKEGDADEHYILGFNLVDEIHCRSCRSLL